MLGVGVFQEHILYLSEWGNVAKEIFIEEGEESMLSLLSSSLKTLQLVTFLAKGISSFWYCF